MTPTPDHIRKAREIAWKVQGPDLRKNRPCPEDVSHIAQAIADAEELGREAERERSAEVAEKRGEPYALNTATGAMMFRAVTEKIAAAIRRSEP